MLVTEEFSVSFLETFWAVVSQDLGSDIIRVSDILGLGLGAEIYKFPVLTVAPSIWHQMDLNIWNTIM